MCKRLFIVDANSRLFTLDPASASPRAVGAIGVPQVTDIAFHGPTLYGVSFSQFLRINPSTGAGTVVGNIGFQTNGLAVSSDGTIFAGTTVGQLIRINPATGAGTLVGNFGGGLVSSGDLAFDSNDVLFGALSSGGTGNLARINTTTGAATVIGPMGVNTVYGMAFFCCRLYGSTSGGDLLHINMATGAATATARNTLNMWGMAAQPCCC